MAGGDDEAVMTWQVHCEALEWATGPYLRTFAEVEAVTAMVARTLASAARTEGASWSISLTSPSRVNSRAVLPS